MVGKNVTIREIQKMCYEILKDVDRVCKENEITYYLSGGSLLGAVRHKAFIPWDDDIDLMMPRNDYERFIKEAPSLLSERFKINSLKTDPDWVRQFARVWDSKTRIKYQTIDEGEYGIFIDIFPIDGTPTEERKSNLFFKKMKYYDVMRNAALRNSFQENEKMQGIKKILKPIAKKKGGRYYAAKMDGLAARYPFDTSEYIAVSVVNHYGSKEKMKRTDIYNSTVELPFEDGMYPAPDGYDTYLKALYGDYMKLPPQAEQISDHMFEVMVEE
jgi:lipopolysaccharide cholinephosphotransferase